MFWKLTIPFCALALLAWRLLDSSPNNSAGSEPEAAAEPERSQPATPLKRWTLPSQSEVKLAPVAEMADELNSPAQSARDDLMIVDQLLTYYRKALGQNPVGLNSEIVLRLAGRNEKSLAVIAPDHAAIDSQGKLTDRWGTPLFFHQVSGARMEIVSAGPDRKLWTGDDIKHLP